MKSSTERIWQIGFFAFLFIVDWYLYFWDIGHFFQGDTVFTINHRPTSIWTYLRAFTQLHPSGWYRPLANQWVEPTFYPMFGLEPTAYRIPVYAVFFGVTIAVYALVWKMTQRRLAAAIATFFFSIHTINAYVTYDVAFMPELMYTFFYVTSILAYLRHAKDGGRSRLLISLALFTASLLSKEAAVTLPGTLLALHVLTGYESKPDSRHSVLRERFIAPLYALRWHGLILLCYLLFVVGHLHVMGVSLGTLVKSAPADHAPQGYEFFILDQAVLKNVDIAMTWAFNIPRGWITEVRNLDSGLVSALKLFRFLTVALLVAVLFTQQRRLLLWGIAWFLITLTPALPLLNHFLPYYLFLPIVGFSLAVGCAFTFACDKLGKSPLLALLVVIPALAVVFHANSVSIHADIANNVVLGGSAKAALNSIESLKRLYPVLPSDRIVYVIDDQEPLWWHHDYGALIRMSYNADNVTALYSSFGQRPPEDTPPGKMIVLRYRNERFFDETNIFRADPDRMVQYVEGNGRGLAVSTREVRPGDSYSLEITAARGVFANITYTVDDGPVQIFSAHFDADGRARFDVLENTIKGSYRFLGFNIAGQQEWVRADATIDVR
jgi:hypothetical protein